MKPCIFSDKIYVPEEYVRVEHKLAFTYEVPDLESRAYGGQEPTTKTIKTYSKLLDQDGQVYYAFARGDLGKIGELFGDIPWEDRTAFPPFNYPLEFTSKLFTYDEKRRGQQEAQAEWLKCRHGVIRAAPRFGKTVLSISLLAKIGVKTLIVAHQQDLIDQFFATFLEHSNTLDLRQEYFRKGRKKRDATGQVVGMFSDYDNPEKLDVALLCWQKFNSKNGPERLEKYREHYGLLICDEVHRAGASRYARVLNNFTARYRLGLTGTYERLDGQERIVNDVIGPVTVEGRVEQVSCKVVKIQTGITVDYTVGEPIQRLLQRLAADPDRNALLIRHLREDCAKGHHICFAYHGASTEQLEQFTALLQANGFQAAAFYGTMRQDRKETLAKMKTGEIQVAVCNGRMLTGIDVPCWDMYYSAFPSANVVFNEEGKLSGNHYQEFSRVRTPYIYPDGRVKERGYIKDFVDELTYCWRTWQKRQKAYKNQGFELEVVKELRVIKPINKEI